MKIIIILFVFSPEVNNYPNESMDKSRDDFFTRVVPYLPVYAIVDEICEEVVKRMKSSQSLEKQHFFGEQTINSLNECNDNRLMNNGFDKVFNNLLNLYYNRYLFNHLKDSMSRFGDDLCELIVSYLPFEDKLRLECLSKQFRRLVFNKQFSLEIPYTIRSKENNNLPKLLIQIGYKNKVNTKALESVLKKFKYIRKVKIKIKVNEKVFSLIGQYCPQLKSFDYTFNWIEEKDLFFAEKYGHKLQELEINGDESVCKKFLEYCPNVTNLRSLKKFFIDERKEFLPNLKVFKGSIDTKDVLIFKKFCEKYSNALTFINVVLCFITDQEVEECLLSISQLKNLEKLNICFGNLQSEPSLDGLAMIGHKCTKISKLNLVLTAYAQISEEIFDILSAFKSLRSLSILGKFISSKGGIKKLYWCSQLRHLRIINTLLDKDFFVDIATTLPNLRTLHINTGQIFSESFIKPFLSMKFIEKVIHRIDYRNSIYSDEWYFGKQLREMKFKYTNIIHITNNCGLVSK